MLSTLLRPKRPRKRADANLQSCSYLDRRATADFTEDDGEDENTEDEDEEGDERDQDEDVQEEEEADEDDEDGEESPLLPIFSAAHLGKRDMPRHCTGLLDTSFLYLKIAC